MIILFIVCRVKFLAHRSRHVFLFVLKNNNSKKNFYTFKFQIQINETTKNAEWRTLSPRARTRKRKYLRYATFASTPLLIERSEQTVQFVKIYTLINTIFATRYNRVKKSAARTRCLARLNFRNVLHPLNSPIILNDFLAQRPLLAAGKYSNKTLPRGTGALTGSLVCSLPSGRTSLNP